jgi:hypothetical protein
MEDRMTYARLGGWLYLVVFVAGIFAENFVRSALIVSGNATATAANIMAHESLWRIGFAADLIMVVCYVAVTLVLYVLLRPVNKNLALLAAFFGMMGNAILATDALGHFAPLLLLGSADHLKAFDPHQLQALALLSLKLHGYGYQVSGVFYGLYEFLLGLLIFKSSYLPKFLGVALIIGSLCYLSDIFALFLAPAFEPAISSIVLVPAALLELSLCVWLIVKGVSVPKWDACRASTEL